MQHFSSPACSLGMWHQGCNPGFVDFFSTLDFSLVDTTSISPPLSPPAMPQLQKKPKLPRWPQENQSFSCAHRVEASQEVPMPAGSQAQSSLFPTTHTPGASKDSSVPGSALLTPLQASPCSRDAMGFLGDVAPLPQPVTPAAPSRWGPTPGDAIKGINQSSSAKSLLPPAAPGGATPLPRSPFTSSINHHKPKPFLGKTQPSLVPKEFFLCLQTDFYPIQDWVPLAHAP